MTPQAIYDAAWHHPGMAWIAAIVAAILFARKQRFLVGWFAIFLIAIVADALFTGALSPVPPRWAWVPGVVFVILGDLRFFVLAERFVRGKLDRRAIATAVGAAFLVPVITEIVRRVIPVVGETPRLTFLFYEVCFLLVALAARFVIYPSRLLGVVPGPVRQWVLSIATFEIVQYGLWIACDLLILAGVEWALVLRIVPNALYYAVFLPFVVVRAPAAAWEGAPRGPRAA